MHTIPCKRHDYACKRHTVAYGVVLATAFDMMPEHLYEPVRESFIVWAGRESGPLETELLTRRAKTVLEWIIARPQEQVGTGRSRMLPDVEQPLRMRLSLPLLPTISMTTDSPGCHFHPSPSDCPLPLLIALCAAGKPCGGFPQASPARNQFAEP